MKVREQLHTDGHVVGYSFKCPGCNYDHSPWTVPFEDQAVWGFNGDVNNPTFTPSILFRTANKNGPVVCHSFVTNGMIQFLGDCTHPLANQTVSLPEIL
jgi:hypothetical protein